MKKFTQTCLATITVLLALNANSQIINTFAGIGSGGFSGDGSTAITADIANPYSTVVDASGNVYIADRVNNRIRKVNTAGIISTYAGNGVAGFSGDGGLATNANLQNPQGIAIDAAGNLYIADKSNHRIRKVNTSGIISTIAGTGTGGFSGDGGLATSANLQNPFSVAVDASGNVYIADASNSRIRKVNTTGIISTYAGNGSFGFSGDGAAAIAAQLDAPTGVAIDGSNNLYIADQSNNRIRKVNVAGDISTFAGTGVSGFSGDGGTATSAKLFNPIGVAVDASSNVYIADLDNNRIRKINTLGDISTIAGTGVAGFSGDGGLAINAKLNLPTGVSIDASGSLYIADQSNHRIRKIELTTTINEFETNSFDYNVYPNPSNSILAIESKNSAEKTVTLTNALGEVLYKNTFKENLKIDLAFPSNVYFLNIQSDKKTVTKKIIISH